MKNIILILLFFAAAVCSNELVFSKMRICEFDFENESFTTSCSPIESYNSKLSVEMADRIFSLESDYIDETYMTFDCYDEDSVHICNGVDSEKDEAVLYFYEDSVVILTPEYESLVLYK